MTTADKRRRVWPRYGLTGRWEEVFWAMMAINRVPQGWVMEAAGSALLETNTWFF